MLALSLPALGMRLGFPDAGNDPTDTMTRQAYDLNAEGFGPGTNGPIVDRRVAAERRPRRARSAPLATRLRAEDGVEFVAEPRINRAGDAAIVTVVPTTSPQAEATTDLTTVCATTVVPDALKGTGIEASIGGITPALEDQSEYMKDRLPLFVGGVVLLSFLLLLAAFRSPLIAAKAGVMNLLSVCAAYGVMTLAAQGGAFGKLIGIDQEVPIAPFMPVMMFAILFGLSMDYEVFLISRIREEYLKDGDTAASGRRRPGEDGAGDHRRGGDHDRRLPGVPGRAGRLPQAARHRSGVGDPVRRNDRQDDPRAGDHAAAGERQLVAARMAREGAAGHRHRGHNGRSRRGALLERLPRLMASNRRIVDAAAAPAAVGPYSHAVVAGGLLFCSGQIPLDPATGELVGVTAAEQADRCLRNLAAVCDAAGASLADAVRLTVYLTDMAAFAEVNDVYAGFFPSDPPARVAFSVVALPKGAQVEIDAVVALPS